MQEQLKKLVADQIITHQQMYYLLAYSYVRNEADAMDILQDSIYKALASLDKLKDPDSIKSWFYRIVVNTSLDRLRKQKREVVAEEELLDGLDQGKEDRYPDLDLWRAMDTLPDELRTIVVLRFFEDYKLEEIARHLQLNLNTVKSRLYRALERLKIQLSDEDLLEGGLVQ